MILPEGWYFCEFVTDPWDEDNGFGCPNPAYRLTAETFRCREHLPLALDS